jgi:hypothetical protein
MVSKCKLLESIPLHIQKLNYVKGIYELENHVGEEVLSLDLPPNPNPNPKLVKTILPIGFPSRLLESV